jgi:hypothetical protein
MIDLHVSYWQSAIQQPFGSNIAVCLTRTCMQRKNDNKECMYFLRPSLCQLLEECHDDHFVVLLCSRSVFLSTNNIGTTTGRSRQVILVVARSDHGVHDTMHENVSPNHFCLSGCSNICSTMKTDRHTTGCRGFIGQHGRCYHHS